MNLAHMNKSCLVAVAVLVTSMSLNAGPVRTLYGTSPGGDRTLYIINGSSATSVNLAHDESAIAVDTTVRTLAAPGVGGQGQEFTLAGTSTGVVYNTPGNFLFYDGTTDGIHNYAVDYQTGGVYSMALDWSSPTLLFSTGDGTNIDDGITYDVQNNSIWVANLSTRRITDYSLTGTALSNFAAGVQIAGLAFDSVDGTLWGNSTADNRLYQFSTTGTVLSTGFITGVSSNGQIRGLEFAEGASVGAPEPATLITSLAGMLVAACFLRRRVIL